VAARVTRPSFSVVVIAHNEAHTLPVLAESLREFLTSGGEFLVVDTGSDDDTVRVAQEIGARVESAGARFHADLTEAQAQSINERFTRGGEGPLVHAGQRIFDFGRAREFASHLASHDMVWHLDASDIVVCADLDYLDSHVRSSRVHSFDYFLAMGRAHFRVARFFDRRLFEWRGRVHEIPFPKTLPADLRRVSCDETQLLTRHVRQVKTRNYLAGLALDAIDDPATPRWLHYLGRELFYDRQYRSAVAVLRAHARATSGRPAEGARSLCIAGQCFEALGNSTAAAALYLKASRMDGSRRMPLLRLARLWQSAGQFQASVAAAGAALMMPQSNPYVDANENDAADPHALLYWGLFWLGRREEARPHWEMCRRLAPDNEKFREDERLFAGRP
jgi:glycosyltransferase involved in cell wall biosynthesis